MARPLLFRFREWLADRFGFQYPQQRVRTRQKMSDAEKAKLKDALRELAIVFFLLLAFAQRREGRALLLFVLLLVGVVSTYTFAFMF